MFIFHVFVLVVVLLVYILLRKAGVSYPLSRILLLSLIFSVLATACLGQNYTESLIPLGFLTHLRTSLWETTDGRMKNLKTILMVF